MSQDEPQQASNNATAKSPTRLIQYREPIIAWLISRIVCITLLILGATYFPIERQLPLRRASPQAGTHRNLRQYFRDYAADFRNLKRFGRQPMLFVSPGGTEAWAKPFIHWDALWWLCVAEVGYVADPQLKAEQNVVFYPLFPFLIWLVSQTGLQPIISALVLVNILMLVAVCLLYRFVENRSGRAAARWTILLWLSFPASFFSVVPYSESLIALFAVITMQGVMSQQYLLTGIACAFASAIKNQGVILAGALVSPFLTGPRRLTALLGGLISGTGLLVYMFYLKQQFGDPFLFVAIQKQWRGQLGNPNPLHWLFLLIQAAYQSLRMPLDPARLDFSLYSSRMLDPWLALWVLCWIPSLRKLHYGLLLSSAVMILLPLSTGTVASLGRYVWVILPVFVVMGESLYKTWWRWPILFLSLIGLVWQTFLFGGGWEVI